MTETPVPAAAVQIATDALGSLPVDWADDDAVIHAVVAALARAGWLHDPAEVAALRAVADAARPWWVRAGWPRDALGQAFEALDALPAGADAPDGAVQSETTAGVDWRLIAQQREKELRTQGERLHDARIAELGQADRTLRATVQRIRDELHRDGHECSAIEHGAMNGAAGWFDVEYGPCETWERITAALAALPAGGALPAAAGTGGGDVERLRAENERLHAELAAAESTIQAWEDPELRAALTEPTSGDYGPVPRPDAVPAGPPPAGDDRGREVPWCNCQAARPHEGPWHPLGDTPFCPRGAASSAPASGGEEPS